MAEIWHYLKRGSVIWFRWTFLFKFQTTTKGSSRWKSPPKIIINSLNVWRSPNAREKLCNSSPNMRSHLLKLSTIFFWQTLVAIISIRWCDGTAVSGPKEVFRIYIYRSSSITGNFQASGRPTYTKGDRRKTGSPTFFVDQIFLAVLGSIRCLC